MVLVSWQLVDIYCSYVPFFGRWVTTDQKEDQLLVTSLFWKVGVTTVQKVTKIYCDL